MNWSTIRFPATLAALATALVLTGSFWASGALLPYAVPEFVAAGRQISGMVMMLIALPTFIVATSFAMQRRSLEYVEQLRPSVPEPARVEAARHEIHTGLASSWRWGGLAGLAMGPFNTQFVHALTESTTPAIDLSISLGQTALWLTIGVSGGVRVMAARTFSRLGEQVEIDLFHLDRLAPLARSRLLDVVFIAVGMALTSLQALDTGVVWENYRFAVLVMIPMAALLLLWPLRSVHVRIRDAKLARLAHLDELIQDPGSARNHEETVRTEALLAHRDRVLELRTWPLDTALLSRFAFYVVIPPLAWVAAALVENFVDRLAAG